MPGMCLETNVLLPIKRKWSNTRQIMTADGHTQLVANLHDLQNWSESCDNFGRDLVFT